MVIARFLDCTCLALRACRTMAPLCCKKLDPFLSLDCARVEGVGAQSRKGRELILPSGYPVPSWLGNSRQRGMQGHVAGGREGAVRPAAQKSIIHVPLPPHHKRRSILTRSTALSPKASSLVSQLHHPCHPTPFSLSVSLKA